MTKKELIDALQQYDDDITIISNTPTGRAGDLIAIMTTQYEKVQTPQDGDLVTEYVIAPEGAELTPVVHLLFGHHCNHIMKV